MRPLHAYCQKRYRPCLEKAHKKQGDSQFLLVFPRAAFLVQAWAKNAVGIVCVILSLVVMLPIPFGNVVPSFAIALFSLALIQEDGIAVVFGILLAFLALTLTVIATVELGNLL